ncbi:MAG: PilZ domain-containing protein [Phycisphaerales bacterium]|nr:MAG: PilZ domain-containing protein [Phycisphaerales bacterium]
MNDGDRREHQRLAVRFPLEYRIIDLEDPPIHRSVSRDISSGGVSFETDCDHIEVGTNLVVDLLVPPGEGHFPYAGRVRSDGRVVRVERFLGAGEAANPTGPRFRIAAQFKHVPKLHF